MPTMSSAMFALVAVGSASGAFVRWAVTGAASESFETASTGALNGLGSLLLGLVVGSKQPTATHRAVGVGFCGGLTTFSSFAVDVAVQLDGGEVVGAVFLLVGTAAFAVTLAWAGYNIGRRRSNV